MKVYITTDPNHSLFSTEDLTDEQLLSLEKVISDYLNLIRVRMIDRGLKK